MAAKASSVAVTIPRGAITSSGRLQKAKRRLFTTLQKYAGNCVTPYELYE